MNITEYLDKIKEFHENLLDFFDKQDDNEEHLQNLLTKFQEKGIQDDKHELGLLFHFIASIANNHHRESNFFEKIEKLLNYFQEEIKKNYSNKEIFHIFEGNKRILLFLLKAKIIDFDQYIYKIITTNEYINKYYPQYFQQEINTKFNENKPLPDNYEENRQIGQNENYICQLIQKDSIEEFITYTNTVNLSLRTKINPSIYETNSFLLENKTPTLIEYATFYGSIQIFNYLRLNEVELTPSLWHYAIHGRNPELIHLLEENQIKPEIEINRQKTVSYREVFFESIKCNHNEIKKYIEDNYLLNENLSHEAMLKSIMYYDFCFIESSLIGQSSFHDFVRFDYYNIVKIILNDNKIDINAVNDNKTALLIAVDDENLDLVQLLISNEKIDINASCLHEVKYNDYYFQDKYVEEITPFYLAVDKENLEIIKLLLAFENLDLNCLNKFVKYDKKVPEKVEEEEEEEEEDNDDHRFSSHDVQDHFYEPIDNRFEYRDPEVTTVKSGKQTSLFLAIEKGNSEIIHLLLQKEKIDFSAVNEIKTETNEYYEKYRRYQDGNIYRWSVKTIKKEEKTSFYLAVEKGNLEIIQYLLSSEKVDINIPNRSETIIDSDKDEYSYDATDSDLETTKDTEIKTALYFAVENEKIEILKLLLNNEKIDANIPCEYNESYDLRTYRTSRVGRQNKEIKTPFYLAVEYKNVEIINLLLTKSKIDINKEYSKNESIVKYIEKDNNEDDDNNIESCSESKIKRTPLHLAVKKDCIEIIKILLNQKGIDLTIKDDEGLTPIELTDNKQILNLLNK
ncbi:hypothetical protein M9Y10_003628 [Tritrichomonas musculus]|uniref:DUF3447 domain-containing protein n=1 Tax=Tritrichomonas musculus TaxID=1915356 RepID=A0ABR2JPY0_9EUKA